MMKWNNKKRNNKGFTLVELVVVIAILGILAGIAVPKLGGSRTKAVKGAHEANIRTLEGAATMFIADEGAQKATWTAEGGTKAEGATTDASDKWKSYLQSWPKVPSGLDDTDFIQYKVVITEDGAITITGDGASK